MPLGMLIGDSFLSSTLWPSDDYLVITAMRLFGHPGWMLAASLAAATAGAVANAYAGRLARLGVARFLPAAEARLLKVEGRGRRYATPGLLASWAMLGQVLGVFAGLFRYPLRPLLLWSFLGQCGFHYFLWASYP